MLTVQHLRQTEYTSNGMSYRYKIMLHFVHVSYNSRIAIFSVLSPISLSLPHLLLSIISSSPPVPHLLLSLISSSPPAPHLLLSSCPSSPHLLLSLTCSHTHT